MTTKRLIWLAVLPALALPLSACTSSHHAASSTTSVSGTTAPATSSSTSGAPPSSSSSSSSSSVPATTAPAPSSTSSVPPGSTRCASSSLSGSLTGENGAAGSVYYTLLVTNHGAGACTLQGWPGVSFVAGSTGQQIGAPASRIPGSSPSVVLAAGSSAGATLQITEATNYGSGCGVTATAGLRVYPPDQTAAIYIPHPDQGCSNTTDVTLHVGAFQS